MNLKIKSSYIIYMSPTNYNTMPGTKRGCC